MALAMLVAAAGASSTLSRPLAARLATPGPAFSSAHSPLLDGPRGPRSEFHLNVGRAIDALQDDYPTMLIVEPNLDIFAERVEFVDSRTGLVVSGKRGYQRALSVMRWVAGVTLSGAETGVLLVFDPIASQIRARWSAKLCVRGREDEPPLHVDGVSVYSLDASGQICRHELQYTDPLPRPLAVGLRSISSFAIGEASELERAVANVP